MSDKSLRFLLYGEDKTASSTFGKTADSAQGATVRIGGAFSKMGTLIGGEVGALVDKIGAGFTAAGEHGAKLGAKMIGVGAAIAGLGVFAQSFASKDQAAHQQLLAAVTATGKGYAGFGDDVEKAIRTQEGFGHKASDTQEALRKMTQAFQDPKKALSEMTLVENLAAAKHISLSEAAGLVAKIHGGAGRVLKEFGLSLTTTKSLLTAAASATKAHESAVTTLSKAQQKLTDLEAIDAGKKKLSIAAQIALRHAHEAVATAQERVKATTETLNVAQGKAKNAAGASDKALEALGKRLSGQAAAASDTFAGKLAGMRAHVEDVGSAVAGKLGPALTVAGPIILGVGAVMESGLIPALGKGAAGLLNMGKRAIIWGVQMLAAGAEAMLPFLPIILVVAAVGVAAFLLWKHWDTVWGFIKGATAAGWNWIKRHLDLIIQVGLGPLGVAIVFLKNHWTQIWSDIKTVLGAAKDWIVGKFTAIVGFVTGLPGKISSAASGLWGGITAGLNDAKNWVTGKFDTVVSYVTGLPGKISSAASGMWDGIKDAFRSAINWIIGKWDALQFTIGGGSILGHAIPSVTLGVPQIPMFASGVSDFAGGLAIVGDGGAELVHLPPHSSVDTHAQTKATLGRGGPTLHIENYNEAHHAPAQIAAELAFRLRTA